MDLFTIEFVKSAMRSKLALNKRKNKVVKEGYELVLESSLVASLPFCGIMLPISYYYNFPFEKEIGLIIYASIFVTNILLGIKLKQDGFYEDVKKEIENMPEEELKKYHKKYATHVICMGIVWFACYAITIIFPNEGDELWRLWNNG